LPSIDETPVGGGRRALGQGITVRLNSLHYLQFAKSLMSAKLKTLFARLFGCGRFTEKCTEIEAMRLKKLLRCTRIA